MCLNNTPTVCENVPIDKLRRGKYHRLNLDHCACAKTTMFRHMAKYRVNKRNCDQVAFNELIKNLNCWFPESEYPSLVYPRIKTTLQRLFNQLVETQIVTSIELNNGGWTSTWPAFTQNWLENDWNGDTGNQLAAAGLTPATTRSQAQDNPVTVRQNSGRPGARSSPIVIEDGDDDLGLSFSGLSIHERHRQSPPPFIRSTPRRPISDITPSFIHPGLPTPPRSSPGFPAGSSALGTDFFRPTFIHPLPQLSGSGHNIASSISMAQTFVPPGSGQGHTSAASVTLALQQLVADDQHAIDIFRPKGLLAVVNKTHRSGEGSSRGASEIGNSLKKLQDPLPLAPSFANMMEQEDAFEKLRQSLLVKISGANVKGKLGEGSGKAATILH